MEDVRWPKKIYHWTPHGRNEKRKTATIRENQVTDFMISRSREEVMVEDNVWYWGMDRRLLAVKIPILYTVRALSLNNNFEQIIH